jgi:CO/xanthine dehydrogenase FAD-binding subunit
VNLTIASDIDTVLTAMASGARPVAGGSDLVVAARHGKVPLPESLVAIDRVSALEWVELAPDGSLGIGALTTHATLMKHPAVLASHTALADASALVGSPATRNVGTLGGNVMNASPAMDTGAPLVVFEATAELRSLHGSRTVPLTDLWTGPGRTAARPDELCTSVWLPARAPRSGSAYVRLEYRRAMEIAVVGAAATVTLATDGTVASATVALTAVAPTILSVAGIAAIADGRSVDAALLEEVASAASAQAIPISDVRASDRYRRHCVGVMARRAFEAAARRAAGEAIAVPVNRALGIGAGR